MEGSKFKLNLSGVGSDSGGVPFDKKQADRFFKFGSAEDDLPTEEKSSSPNLKESMHKENLLPGLESSKEGESMEISQEAMFTIDGREFYQSFDFGKHRLMSKLEDSLEMKGLADSVNSFMKQSDQIQAELQKITHSRDQTEGDGFSVETFEAIRQ